LQAGIRDWEIQEACRAEVARIRLITKGGYRFKNQRGRKACQKIGHRWRISRDPQSRRPITSGPF
jgi:hypothetical protein